MTETERAEARERFRVKNERRRDGRASVRRDEWRDARALRQSVGGAFGRAPLAFRVAASVGTSARV